MSPRKVLLTIILFCSIALERIDSDGSRVMDNLSTNDRLVFCCPTEQCQYHCMKAWASSAQALALRKDRALERHNSGFNSFLNTFVEDSRVRNLLDKRIHINFNGRTAADLKEYKELADIMITAEERVAIRTWFQEFSQLLGAFGGVIHRNAAHEEPGTVAFSFEKYPDYVVKCLAWNYYPLGCYDPSGRYSCLVPGCRISGYSFPLQLVSRVLYAQEINKFVTEHHIDDVAAPEKWLYIFPWASREPLSDANLFVVAERVEFKQGEQKQLLHILKKELGSVAATRELLVQKASDLDNHSLLAHMARVILAVGLYDFFPKTQNFVMCRSADPARGVRVVFTDTERPPFGGSDPLNFFHLPLADGGISQEVVSNGRVGLDTLASFLNELNSDECASRSGDEKET
jgi:hypothetical protein